MRTASALLTVTVWSSHPWGISNVCRASPAQAICHLPGVYQASQHYYCATSNNTVPS